MQNREKKLAKNAEKLREKSRKIKENRLSVYLSHHRRDIAQTFMADSPNDALQTYKVSGRKSPRGKVGEQKKKNRAENLEDRENRGENAGKSRK